MILSSEMTALSALNPDTTRRYCPWRGSGANIAR